MSNLISVYELTELAAKAANLPERGWMADSFAYVKNNTWVFWDPLNDDGDAFRLALQLGINIWRDADVIWCSGNSYMIGEKDYLAVAREAIVKAAAAIGMRMK